MVKASALAPSRRSPRAQGLAPKRICRNGTRRRWIVGNELDSVDGDGASPDRFAIRNSERELARLTDYADAQERKVQELQTTVAQLQFTLESRVTIERAIGMLAERLSLPVYDAFEVIRSAARKSRREVRSLAEELLEDPNKTPPEIVEASALRTQS